MNALDEPALARLLLVLYEYNKKKTKTQPLSTRALLNAINSTHHGQSTIRKAERSGYIKRWRRSTNENNKSVVGQPPILHSLTPKGIEFAKRLAKLAH